jgi:hypothetical protein
LDDGKISKAEFHARASEAVAVFTQQRQTQQAIQNREDMDMLMLGEMAF